MSMTVRFPNGQAVTYNSADWVLWSGGVRENHELYTKEGGNLVAVVPPTCIVEFMSPCKVENVCLVPTLEVALSKVWAEAREASWRDCQSLADVKRLLADFNMQTKCWMR